MSFGSQEVVDGDRCRGSLKNPSFNFTNHQINCFNCSPPSVVLTKHSALPRTALSAPDFILIYSSCVPSSATVPPSAPPFVNEPLHFLGPAPVTTTPAPGALPASDIVVVRTLLSPDSEASDVPFPDFLFAESNIASLGPASSPAAPALAPAHLDSDPLLAIANATSWSIQRAPCLKFSVTGNQSPTLSPPTSHSKSSGVTAAQKYAYFGCLATVGLA